MSEKRQIKHISWIGLFALVTLGLGLFFSPISGQSTLVVAAQSTGDRLPTRTPTATPVPGSQVWIGRLVSNTLGVTEGQGSIFRVRVEGLVGTPIELRSGETVITGESGSKPEYGPYTAEFAPVMKGTWTVSVPSLDVSLEVVADNYNLAVIEFVQIPAPQATQVILPDPTETPRLPPATFIPTPVPDTVTPTLLPTSTATAAPTLTPTSPPSPTATPLSSPTPVTRWLGVIAGRKKVGGSDEPAAIEVKVAGIAGLPVRLRATSIMSGERRCITGQETQIEQDVCHFEDLKPGQYIVAPEGLGLSLPVAFLEKERVRVVFDLESLPVGITGWQAKLLKNSSGFRATPKTESVITVRVAGRAGQVVALRSVRGTEQFCEVAPNPVLGNLACEFGELGPGVYLVELLNTGAGWRLFVDGTGVAEIEFSPSATYATLAMAQSPPVVGHGAEPKRPTATATATVIPTQVAVIRPTFTPTSAPTPTITPTPTPAFAWQGRIVETQDGVVGTIGVRAAGLKDHAVILRSGDWQSQPLLTGAKPELGEYAVEFGGLAQGEYIIELVDLAELKVRLGPGQFMLVEFRYDLVE